MKKTYSKYFIAVLVVFTAFTAYFIFHSIYQNDGHFIYPLDDTYIHMSIAKHFAQEGVWGLTSHEFSSGSSSILFTLILSAAFLIFGTVDIIPLILNIIIGYAFLYYLYKALPKLTSPGIYFLISLSAVLFVPLYLMVISGMEHTLQIFLSCVFLLMSAGIIADTGKAANRQLLALSIITSLTAAVRYESLFLIDIAVLAFFIKRKFLTGIIVTISGLWPVILYGLISISNGSYFIPNTLLVKGHIPEFGLKAIGGFIFNSYKAMFSPPFLILLIVALFLAAVVLLHSGRKDSSTMKNIYMILIILPVYFIHLTFARTGWLFRYEAYLIAMTIIAMYGIAEYLKSEYRNYNRTLKITLAVFLLLLATPLVLRFGGAIYRADKAMNNIYSHSIQISKFIHKYYDHKAVAAADIGALTYYNDVDLFDMAGLATVDVVKNKDHYDKHFIENYAKKHGVQIAFFYEKYFKDLVPDSWIRVCRWSIPDNRVLGDATVSFFAVAPGEAERLKENLREFSKQLPDNVSVKFY